MKIRYHNLIEKSSADGPGERAVLFVQGCSLACPGCQSPHLWPAHLGEIAEVRDVARRIKKLAGENGLVTLSGGEIFQQPEALAEMTWTLRDLGVRHIVAYTGYRWEELFSTKHPARPWLKEILSHIDVLVDGRFQRNLDDALIMWRGSRNQRPIDVPASLKAGTVVALDWDAPRALIRSNGEIVLPEGLARELKERLGKAGRTRMCGETRPEGAR